MNFVEKVSSPLTILSTSRKSEIDYGFNEMSKFCPLCRSITLQLKDNTRLTVKRAFAKVNDADLKYVDISLPLFDSFETVQQHHRLHEVRMQQTTMRMKCWKQGTVASRFSVALRTSDVFFAAKPLVYNSKGANEVVMEAWGNARRRQGVDGSISNAGGCDQCAR